MARYQLKRWGAFLATRECGRQVRQDVTDHLTKVPIADVLVLDFSGVQSITVSFGDELVAKLVVGRESGEGEDRRIVIEGANEDVRETLEIVLARRQLPLATITAASAGSSITWPAALPG